MQMNNRVTELIKKSTELRDKIIVQIAVFEAKLALNYIDYYKEIDECARDEILNARQDIINHLQSSIMGFKQDLVNIENNIKSYQQL
jgi:hypothetical protein